MRTAGGLQRGALIAPVLLAPAALLFLAFVAWPLVELIVLSTTKTDFITTSFVGLGNYLALFGNEPFRQAAGNSLAYMALLVPGQVGGALVVSLLAFNLRKGWLDFARIAFYVPVLAAGVIIAQSWKWIFSQRGLANWLIGLVGLPPVSWFGDGVIGITVVSIILAFSTMGSYIIIFLAAMASIDPAILDAAQVDGASWFRIKTRIIVPMIWPTIAGCATLTVIAAPQIYETINFLAPYDHTASMTFQIYSQAFRYSRHGLAAAMAVVLAIVTAGATAAQQKMSHE